MSLCLYRLCRYAYTGYVAMLIQVMSLCLYRLCRYAYTGLCRYAYTGLCRYAYTKVLCRYAYTSVDFLCLGFFSAAGFFTTLDLGFSFST